MKRAVALVLAFVFCLSLCACGQSESSQSTQKGTKPSATGGLDDLPDNDLAGANDTQNLYDHTLAHTLLDSLYGDWHLEGSLSWMVMPTKIIFYEDGTCFAEFPEYATEQTKTLHWGIVPDCVDYASAMYVRLGVSDDVWYLFELKFNAHQQLCAAVAQHCFDSVEKVSVDGLSQDGYSGMWFTMLREETVRHPPVEEICGEWKTNTDEAPFRSLIINADGTCVVDGVDARWQEEDTFTNKESLSIFVLVDDEARFGIVYFSNTGVSTLTESIGGLVGFLPYEAFRE